MADESVKVLQDSTGDRFIDGESVTGHEDGTVFRQRVQLAGSALAEVVKVSNQEPGNTDYGLLVRNIRDRYLLTPFGEQRTATPRHLGSYVQRYGLDTEFMATSVNGTGTVTSNAVASETQLAVAANADFAKQRTKIWHLYEPGHSTRVRMTTKLSSAGTANRIARFGMFSDEDGLYFEEDTDTSAGLALVVRSNSSGSTVNTRVAQASWNVDPMDGTGPSGLTLDLTKFNIFEFAFQWLGAGDVWWFVNGHLAHVSVHAGQESLPYMSSGQLPLSWEISSSGGTGTLHNLCSGVVSEGGREPERISFGAVNPNAVSVPTTPGETVISLRAAATYNGVRTNDNRVAILPEQVVVSNTGSRAVLQVVLNPTLTGTPSWVAPTGSAAEYDISNDTFTGGTIIKQALVENNASLTLDISDLFSVSGRALRTNTFTGAVADVLSIVVYDQQSGTTDIIPALTWTEAR